MSIALLVKTSEVETKLKTKFVYSLHTFNIAFKLMLAWMLVNSRKSKIKPVGCQSYMLCDVNVTRHVCQCYITII